MLAPFAIALLYIFDTLINLYIFVVIVAVVVSWLITFGVLDMRNHLTRSLLQILDALTRPVLRPIRRIVPSIGGLDLSPIILVIGLKVIQILVDNYASMGIAYLYR